MKTDSLLKESAKLQTHISKHKPVYHQVLLY